MPTEDGDTRTPAPLSICIRGSLSAVSTVPGVEEAAFVNFMPPGGGSVRDTQWRFPDARVSSDDDALYVTASEGYLRTMRLRLCTRRGGSPKTTCARPETESVISESVAKRYWPNADALGKVARRSFAHAQVRPDLRTGCAVDA